MMNVLSNMLNCPLKRGEIFVKNDQQPMYDISSVIELSGKAQGTAVFSISRKAALRAADEMLPNTSNSLDENIVDLVGELTNIIVGNAQKELEHYDMHLSPPKVITGRSHCIDFPKGVMPLCVPFKSEWGPMSLEVGFRERSADELEDLSVA